MAPLIIIGCVTYAPLSGVYECPLCSHGPRGPVGVQYDCREGCRAQNRNWRYVSLSYAHGARVTRQTAEEGVGRDKKRNRQLSN